MFPSSVYSRRRTALRQQLSSGIALFIGNFEAPMNYPANTYSFRQDSDFLYLFGIDIPNLVGVIDIDSGVEIIFGNDVTLDDIVWMGSQPSINELASRCGVANSLPIDSLMPLLSQAITQGRKIHFLPPYRGDNRIFLSKLMGLNIGDIKAAVSEELIRAIVSLRIKKEPIEIEEIESAVNIAYTMHTTAMQMCREGMLEQIIAGTIDGIARAYGAGVSFPTILTMNGQTLHNHSHNQILREGRFMVVDAGAETNRHYASDITRTTPVNGKFSTMQRDIYEIVLKTNQEAIASTGAGRSNRDTHLLSGRILAEGLKAVGLMKGDIDEAVSVGAHSLFMPHGIGHLLGLDVHDMEGLGENLVGYGDKNSRSSQFGLSFLRFARQYEEGHVFTIEPGIYFIPDLIERWRAENRHSDFINYSKIEPFIAIGGVRIEDNVAITATGHKVLGTPIPKTIEEIELLLQ